MQSNLARIRELTEKLDHSNFVPTEQVGDAYIYDFEGEAITHGLCHTPEVAMARLHMKAGTVFPQHTHNMLEVFIVLEGEVELTMWDEEWHLTAGHPIYTLPNVPHGGLALTDAVMLCITIPADPSFPHPVKV